MNLEELADLVSQAYRETSDPLWMPEDTRRWANDYRGPVGTARETRYGETPAAPMDALDVSAMAPGVGDVTGPMADLRMYARDPEQITPANVGLSLAGLLPFVPSAAGVVVHHGTPHRWMSEPEFPEGRPRMDKIGTGEGAQAYGHGIYFAENPKVATDYREKLSEKPTVKLDGKPYEELPPPGTPGGVALHALVSDRAGKFGDVKGTLDYLEKVSEMGTGDSPTIRRARKRYRDAYAWLEKQAPRLTVEKPGTLYELDLPDDIVPRMLDWDAPLNEQPENVQSVFKRPDGGFGDYEGLTGMQALMKAASQFGGKGKSAEVLGELGIPGVKYHDAMSRRVGEGTRNYVVWDQDLLNQMPILGVK